MNMAGDMVMGRAAEQDSRQYTNPHHNLVLQMRQHKSPPKEEPGHKGGSRAKLNSMYLFSYHFLS